MTTATMTEKSTQKPGTAPATPPPVWRASLTDTDTVRAGRATSLPISFHGEATPADIAAADAMAFPSLLAKLEALLRADPVYAVHRDCAARVRAAEADLATAADAVAAESRQQLVAILQEHAAGARDAAQKKIEQHLNTARREVHQELTAMRDEALKELTEAAAGPLAKLVRVALALSVQAQTGRIRPRLAELLDGTTPTPTPAITAPAPAPPARDARKGKPPTPRLSHGEATRSFGESLYRGKSEQPSPDATEPAEAAP
jgi:hypothetical protein